MLGPSQKARGREVRGAQSRPKKRRADGRKPRLGRESRRHRPSKDREHEHREQGATVLKRARGQGNVPRAQQTLLQRQGRVGDESRRTREMIDQAKQAERL